MDEFRPRRILVVSDNPLPSDRALTAIRTRADRGASQFRLLVPNPARAELHALHPERHDKAFEAELVLLESLALFESAAGGRIIGTVSVRHDPMDAIEDVLAAEPIDEIMLCLQSSDFARLIHQELPHRLRNYGLPTTTIAADPA